MVAALLYQIINLDPHPLAPTGAGPAAGCRVGGCDKH